MEELTKDDLMLIQFYLEDLIIIVEDEDIDMDEPFEKDMEYLLKKLKKLWIEKLPPEEREMFTNE